ncbi:MAG TPA: hypothetical protein VGK58_20130, partial [Lacipirellulaceae bacterium]
CTAFASRATARDFAFPICRPISDGQRVRGRLYSALALSGPARLLFDDRFITAIVIPFMQALGAA